LHPLACEARRAPEYEKAKLRIRALIRCTRLCQHPLGLAGALSHSAASSGG
jgi:hypothetical protein